LPLETLNITCNIANRQRCALAVARYTATPRSPCPGSTLQPAISIVHKKQPKAPQRARHTAERGRK
jgi:hypothetical protein